MIKNLILINSANFSFLNLDLEKDLFFLGDNGSGKTTVIRAIHYLFSADVRNLGIPTDKDGFKEYYFRYPDSYIVYVFESFFIFMYKSGGEIVKVFSKQAFSLERIFDDNRKLYELESIKHYLKEAPLKRTVKSVNEYRDIIYGHDKRFSDFVLSPIKNSDIFLGLFNEIFNIDKSIIDAKSIKKAIQTTLDYEKNVIDFNHEAYLQKIYEFQAEYQFFKAFEKQKESVDSANVLKEQLLGMEDDIEEIRGGIAFRIEQEKNLSLVLSSQLDATKKALDKSEERYKNKEKVLRKRDERYKNYANALILEVAAIIKLKEKFSSSALLQSRERADQFEQIKNKIIRLTQEKIKLEQGFANALESIDKEREALVYKRDKELVREFEGKVFAQEQNLQAIMAEKIAQNLFQQEQEEKKVEYEIGDLEAEIKAFQSSIVKEKSALQTLLNEQKKELELQRSASEKRQQQWMQSLQNSQEEIRANHAKMSELSYTYQDLQRAQKEQTSQQERIFSQEFSALEVQKNRYISMLEVKPDSFKEFLQEEVDGWESALYPIIDATLLDKTTAELKPRLVESSKLFGIALDTQNLKQILTKEEASQKIEAINLAQEGLESSYQEALKVLQLEFEKNLQTLEEEKSFLTQNIESLNAKITTLQVERKNIEVQEAQVQQELKALHNKQEKELRHRLSSLEDEIENNRQWIDKRHKSLGENRKRVQQESEHLKEEFLQNIKSAKAVLENLLKAEQESVTHAMKLLEEKKHNISKDERIRELHENITKSEREHKESIQAQNFLEEFEKERERLKTLALKQNDLENAKLKNSEFVKCIEEKKEHYKNEQYEIIESRKTLFDKQKRVKKGLEKLEKYEEKFEEISPLESDEYLGTLLEKYDELSTEYKNKKINLKTKLDKLNSLKNMQNEIEISFKFEEFDAHLYISRNQNILLKLEEIVEFKNKKLEILKQLGHKKFVNFIKALLPQKISVFSQSEDKFIAQVAKINKNLSTIDFGVIKDIHIDTKTGDKKSVAKLLEELRDVVSNLSSVLGESSLFYDRDEVYRALEKLEEKFKAIKEELKGSTISLQDTIDLSLSFVENGKAISQVVQLKNESSTGGSMLLKIAIAVAILQLFITQEKTPFFLIVDEVSRLHSNNQERLRTFANAKGFKIVFVTPEPTYSKPDEIKYYRFRKNAQNEFEAIQLNV